MNVENARKLIEFMRDLEAQRDIEFSMPNTLCRYSDEDGGVCHTAACIAGEEYIRVCGMPSAGFASVDVIEFAEKSLGLTSPQGCNLFIPWHPTREAEEPWEGIPDKAGATREQGIQALENAIKMWGSK